MLKKYKVVQHGGKQYFFTFIEDYTYTTKTYIAKLKSK